MKKTLLAAACAALPFGAMANDITPAFFVEYGTTVLQHTSMKMEFGGINLGKENTFGINGNGFFALGADINGIQIALTPSFQNGEDESEFDFLARADIPLMQGKFQPFISFEAGLAVVSIDTEDIDKTETGFAYGAGLGIKYSFNNNMFIKGSFNFRAMNLDMDMYGYSLEMNSYTFDIRSSIGYKF